MRLQGESLDVTTVWEGEKPVDTRIVLPLTSPLDTTVEAAVDRMPPEARRMIDELRGEGLVLQIGSPGVEATLRAPVNDPAALEGRMERIAHLVRVLCAGPSAGPYR